jgi:hypothetical protein
LSAGITGLSLGWSKFSRLSVGILTLLLLATSPAALADQGSSSGALHLSKENRVEIVRSFTGGMVYARTTFPLGKSGLALKDGKVTPSGSELEHMLGASGAAARPGDPVSITNITIKDDHIHFEINGGPVRDPKWYEKVTITGANGTVPMPKPKSPGDVRGSFVDLYFDKDVREITGPQLRQLLSPVFNFQAKSSLEAYIDTVPPKVRDAIKDHNVLVGMNREMLLYAKGIPNRKLRENDSGTEHEDWIYGEPPQDVEFVRLIGDEVIRVEIMKVNGERIVRTEKEIDAHAINNRRNSNQGVKATDTAPTAPPPDKDPCKSTPDGIPGAPPNSSANGSPTPSSGCTPK